jgi:methylated-DNA-[protein]-cysteine S-methyltransferase
MCALFTARSYNIRTMGPTRVRYDAPGWGVGELWLEGETVVASVLPRTPGHGPRASKTGAVHAPLVERLQAFFAGEAVSFVDVAVVELPGFHGECARVLRRVERGELVTYGELAALAGRPRAARAAGTFCARCDLAPFVPTHRVVGAGGIGGYGDLGTSYKRRLLELEHVRL